jgi:glycosyltransferase involved in cell wall biosynthesis
MAKNLAARGHQVTLLASNRRPNMSYCSQELEGVRVIEFPDFVGRRMRNGGLSPIDLAGRMLYALSGRFDVVHGFDHRPAVTLPALTLGMRKDTLFVADWADFWGRGGIADLRVGLESFTVGLFDHYWERWTRKWADGITCISTELKLRAKNLGVAEQRIRLIPAGSNVDVIRPLPKEAMRRKFGIDPESHVAVHIGFSAYDEQLLAKSFVELVRLDPRACLVMTGRRLPLLDQEVQNAKLQDRVVHLGFPPYSMLGEILACGDVMLLPYSRIGTNIARFPNRAGDYLAAGRPIVTNPTGDLGRIVADEGVGLVADENPYAFAAAVAKLFGDRELRNDLGLRARRLAETRYDWRILAGEVERMYMDLLSS